MRIERTPNKDSKGKITRRGFLGILTGGLGASIIFWYLKKRIGQGRKEFVEKEFILEDFLRQIHNELSEIENRVELKLTEEQKEETEEKLKKFKENWGKLAYPLKAYFIEDPSLSLDTLWEKKNDYIKEIEEDEGLILKFRKIKLNFLRSFEDKPRGYIEDLNEFEDYIRKCITESMLVLDIEALFKHERYNFEEEKINLILEILKDEKFIELFTRSLISLILVEICYIDENAKNNKNILIYLLRKNGLRFLSFVPSIYDKRLSIGPFQLTDLVIGEEKDKFYPLNFMNNFIKEFDEEVKEKYKLPQYKLPNSLEQFEIRHHYRAEVYLLVFYLLELFRKFEIDQIKKAYQKDKNWFYYQICYYLAGCHHLPVETQKLFKKFLDNEENIEQEKSFVDFANTQDTNKDLLVYLDRFRANLKGAE